MSMRTRNTAAQQRYLLSQLTGADEEQISAYIYVTLNRDDEMIVGTNLMRKGDLILLLEDALGRAHGMPDQLQDPDDLEEIIPSKRHAPETGGGSRP